MPMDGFPLSESGTELALACAKYGLRACIAVGSAVLLSWQPAAQR